MNAVEYLSLQRAREQQRQLLSGAVTGEPSARERRQRRQAVQLAKQANPRNLRPRPA